MSELTDASAVPPMPENPPAAGRRWPRPLVTGLAGLAVGVVAVGLAWGLSSGGGAGTSPGAKPVKTFTMKGDMKLVLSLHEALQQLSQGGQCMPRHSGPYMDIQEGATVTVYSASGKVVATGALQQGVPSATDCTFPFTASGVPEGEKFYQVEVEHSGRKPVSAQKARQGEVLIELKSG
ncbi:hypothetical protein [Streptomyces olivochromogenes]|uniref:hypothetical protein n=1 Tax=Streptomyces olivochromogenes TaxID=1963 RepID=UPI00131A8307|nr:hypothetical protein [Streptomyces olivochromogenes]